MFRFILVVIVSFLVTGYPFHGAATDWIFKGQPKDGSAHYSSSAAQDRSRAQHLDLLAHCERMMQTLSPTGDTKSFQDPNKKRSTMNDLVSCGLLYAGDHQQEKAGRCYDRALELAQLFGDRTEQAKILNYLAIGHTLWGQFANALEYHKRSLARSIGTADYQNQAISYNQIGHIAMVMGDYRKALASLKQAVALQAKAPDSPFSPLPLNTLGHLNAAWGNYDKALECYRRALKIEKKLGLAGLESASHVLLGRVYKLLGRDEEALSLLKEGLKLCEKHGYPIDTSIDEIGNLYLDRGDTEKAESYIKQAGFWQSLGRLHLMKRNLQVAERNYIKLRDYSKPKRMFDYLWVAQTGLGIIKEQNGDLQAAAHDFRAAIGYIESMRSTLTAPERMGFFNVNSGGFFRTAPYEGLARVLINLNKPVEAMKESEYTKARVFAERLSKRAEGSTPQIPRDLLNRDCQLNDQLAALTKSLQEAYEKENKEVITVLEPRVKRAKEALAAHVDMLRKKYPFFAAAKYPQPMDLSQTALTDKDWVLAYHVTDPGIIIYLTKGKNLVKGLFKPTPRKDIDQLVRKFRQPMELSAEDSFQKKLTRFDFSSGKKLSDILLSDVLPDLPKDSPVIIVPDGSLGVVPFEMLVLNDGGKIVTDKRPQVSGAEFFGDRNPISYYQSITALTLARTLGKQQKPGDKLLAMVDPVFSSDDPRLVKLAREEKDRLLATLPKDLTMSIETEKEISFPRLPLTAQLGESLKKADPKTDLYEGMQAKKSVLLQRDLTAYRSLVFATHGYFGKDLPGIQEPVLVLSLVGEPSGKDGFLRLSEVMGLKINCDIAALTACQSGLGRVISGEGTMGMGRAFQYAGAKSVLMSLWSVAEKSSVQLVENFFKHLKDGKSKLESLRLARDEIRKAGYDHPFFWAPFILVGEVE